MEQQTDIEVLKRALERERRARKSAEKLLEEKSIELYEVNQQLIALNNSLEQQISTRTEELEASRAEQQSTALKLSALIRNLQAGVLVEDETRHIVLVNQHFLTLFGIPAEPQHLVGVDCSQSAEQSKDMFKDPQEFVDRIDRILAQREVVLGDELELADGRFFERDFIPVIDSDRYLGHLWHYKDITHRKRSQRQLLHAKQQAEASSKAREVFLANISHEIRTPMNAILGISDLLLQNASDSKNKDQLQVIRRSAENMLVLINDLLDLTKIDSGKLRMERMGFSIPELTQFLVQAMDISASNQNIRLRQHSDPQIPPVVMGDPYRLNQILTNLLNNAIKFTEKGSVTLRTQLEHQDSERVSVLFTIEDTGIGIDQEKLDEIFESFRQANDSITRRFGGTGLGLTISRKLVDLLGGEIDVQSKKGVGTTFQVRLEFDLGTAEDLNTLSPADAGGRSLAGSRILVVEDHEYNQILAVSILEEWKVDVVVAGNGKAALEHLKDTEFDLVLMDVQMPIMNGLEATLAIRNQLRLDTPIIGLSANAFESEAQRCLSAGMDDFVTKPFSSESLYETVLKYISPSPTPAPTPTRLDLRTLYRHVNHNEELAQRLVKVFVDTMPAELERIREAAAQENASDIKAILHQIRPSLKIMSAPAFFEKMKASGEALGESPGSVASIAGEILAELDALLTEISA